MCASVTHHLPLYTSIECVFVRRIATIATIVRRGLLIGNSLQLTIYEKISCTSGWQLSIQNAQSLPK